MDVCERARYFFRSLQGHYYGNQFFKFNLHILFVTVTKVL